MTKILKTLVLFFSFSLFVVHTVQADDFLQDFTFSDTQEKVHSISEWKGKLLVINFWATWCQPCLKEIPELMALQTQYSKKNVQFIGIAIDDLDTVLRYKNAVNINYPILVSNEWEGFDLSHKLGNTANTVPFTVVVNSAGKIVYRYAGAVKKEALIAVFSVNN